MSLACPTVRVHGLDYLDTSPKQLHALLTALLREHRGVTIFTPNAQIGAACRQDASLRALIHRADVLLPDGAGVVLASHRCCPAHPLRYRLPGIEAAETVLQLCSEIGLSVYFLGGKPGIALTAAKRWQHRLPDLRIAGAHDGYFDKTGEANTAVVHDIAARGADVVFVCFGFPVQERWIIDNRPSLPSVRLFMGLGGSFDVWAGKARRAPVLVQHAHMEWLWRMLAEPRRFSGLPHMLRYIFYASIRGK